MEFLLVNVANGAPVDAAARAIFKRSDFPVENREDLGERQTAGARAFGGGPGGRA